MASRAALCMRGSRRHSNTNSPRSPRGQPEIVARHCTDAGLMEKAAGFWGKAGERSLAGSALIEGIEQLTRGLGQIATLPGTPTLRREEIKLQVALITPLLNVKVFAGNAPRFVAVV